MRYISDVSPVVHLRCIACGTSEMYRFHLRYILPLCYCMISTITFLSSLDAAAFTTARIAFAMRPCFPITLPISDCATLSSSRVPFSFSDSVTTTSSGKSTSDFAIHIDLIEGYVNKGFEIFEFDKLYGNTAAYKEYRVLNQPYDIAMLLLYKVIGAKELKQRYRDKISAGYKSCKNEIRDILVEVLGSDLAQKVCSKVEADEYEWIVDHSKVISRTSKKIAFKKHPISTVVNVMRFLNEKVYRIGICPKKYRKMIALEAPDGTGKTTFIDALTVMLAETFVCDIEKMHVYHFRPSVLPNLGAVGEKAGVMKQDTNFENPHRNKAANPLSSFVRMGYYWLDYLIGGAICIRKDVQFDKITIFDRYIYDFIIDPLRSRINLPRCMRTAFSKMVQQPRIVFVLDAPADVIYSRKKELTLDEIQRQLEEFDKLSNLGDNFYKINANQTPEKMVLDAKKIILDKFCLKIQK